MALWQRRRCWIGRCDGSRGCRSRFLNNDDDVEASWRKSKASLNQDLASGDAKYLTGSPSLDRFGFYRKRKMAIVTTGESW